MIGALVLYRGDEYLTTKYSPTYGIYHLKRVSDGLEIVLPEKAIVFVENQAQ
ncbi:hypothetical protein PP175_28460 (plasmid) [Aneurinibacillus sp. Ricciae_BoGa-3]|uniref:hypothetical protein n=1 Tax=Aneurinibacillus sp. Ricciae_BoGa-3 TaxID=3022697 RepID=UPI00233F9722|nr:hypothetical protein [Aneurinibacillus sp. Ricciae_BoGa-3]WCK57125.1 hypothetical protein PP175_28460 [Aneurinibacillus sp. Ricciae_BoGa-3]